MTRHDAHGALYLVAFMSSIALAANGDVVAALCATLACCATVILMVLAFRRPG